MEIMEDKEESRRRERALQFQREKRVIPQTRKYTPEAIFDLLMQVSIWLLIEGGAMCFIDYWLDLRWMYLLGLGSLIVGLIADISGMVYYYVVRVFIPQFIRTGKEDDK